MNAEDANGPGASAADPHVFAARAARLPQSENTFRQLIENGSDLIAVVDEHARLTYVSPSIRALLGYAPEELIGVPVFDFIAPDDVPIVASALEHRVRTTGAGRTRVFRFRHRDGSWRHLEALGTGLSEDSPIGRVVINARDITERRAAEEALRQSEERFRLAARATADLLYDWDIAAGTVTWNDVLFTSFHYDRDDTERGIDWWTDQIHRDDLESVQSTLEDALQGTDEFWSHEYRFRRGDGSYADVLDRGFVVRDAAGRPVRMIGSMLDLSDRHHLQEQLRQAQRMEAVGRLAGGVAHDFNNLLTAIAGHAEFLLESLGQGTAERADAREIARAAARAASLTSQLLAFSRQQMLQPRVLNLNEVLANMETMLRRLIGEHIQLVISPAPDLGATRADRGQIEQVVLNLAVNAKDSMADGGALIIETANATIDEREARRHAYPVRVGDYVLLRVRDTGAGIESHVIEHIFEPFFTTKDIGQGTGLGLATVYGIVKQSGGYIWVESPPGEGATFRIYLPRIEARAPESPRERPSRPAAGGTETVLLVEDERAVRELARRILLRDGYEVLDVTNGAEALQIIDGHEGSIDLLLTDVIIPGPNGRQLAERTAEVRPDTRVLMMSGYSEDEVLRRRGGEFAFLQKPFSPDAFRAAVRAVLDGRPVP